MKFRDFLLGICAGAAIAVGGLLNIIAKAYIPDPWGKIVGSVLFPVGLIMVCFLSFALFTGKVGYTLNNKPKYLLYLLTIYLGNLAGALGMGFLVFLLTQNVTAIREVSHTIAVNKATFSGVGQYFEVFGFACLCGMLVYIAVFNYKSFKHIVWKVIGIIIPIGLFVYLGFDHCVANMFYFMNGFYGSAFTTAGVYINLAIVTLGNSVGAILLNIPFSKLKKPAK